MTLVARTPSQMREIPMGIKINKEGRLVKTTIKAKDVVLYSETDFAWLLVAAIMISAINIFYIINSNPFGIF